MEMTVFNYQWNSKSGQHVWFCIIENIRSELSNMGVEQGIQSEIIQIIKNEAFKKLDIRRNMLNLREEHIPRIKEIYDSVLQMYVNSE